MRLKSARSWALLAIALVVTACGDAQVGEKLLKPVHAGMPKDSLMMLIGTGPLTAQYADTSRVEKGFRHDLYLVNGVTYDVLYYREEKGNVAEPVLQAVETPVVLTGGKVLGWGWKYYVNTAMKTLKLPSPIKAETPPPEGLPKPVPIDSSAQAGVTKSGA